MEPSWYGNRRGQYRSIAFGTWKASSAGKGNNNNLRGEEEVILRDKSFLSGNKKKLDRNSRRMGESSPNLYRIHPTVTQMSLGDVPLCLDVVNLADCDDCYSSTEYVEFIEEQRNTPQLTSESLSTIFNKDRIQRGSVSPTRRSRLETSVQRAHYRSRSAGADVSRSVALPNEQPPMKTDTNTKFLRATKRFFRKLYDSATLPASKRHLDKKSEERNTDNISPPPAIVTDDYMDELSTTMDSLTTDTDSGRGSSRLNSNEIYQMDTYASINKPPPSLPSSDYSSTTTYSPRRRAVTDLFQQLQQEMNDMRQRDAQILSDLHKVEKHIQNAKRAGLLPMMMSPVPSIHI